MSRTNIELDDEVVAEVMRRYGVEQPYEKLKALTRGQAVGRDRMADFIARLEIPPAARERLLALTPATYLGKAAELARSV